MSFRPATVLLAFRERHRQFPAKALGAAGGCPVEVALQPVGSPRSDRRPAPQLTLDAPAAPAHLNQKSPSKKLLQPKNKILKHTEKHS